MKIFIRFIILVAVAFNAHARLNIEITQGMAGGVPIAVQSSASERHAGQTSFEDLSVIIRNDLKMSGRFEAKYPEQLPQLTSTKQEIELSTWKPSGVENAVLGSVTPNGNGTYNVTFQLLDVYQTAGRENNTGTILTGKTFFNVRANDFRAMAHHISDIVFEKLTGIRGAFSTRIAYVMVVKTMSGNRYSLEISDADGFNPRTLVNSKEPLMSPSWAPDGKWISFVSFEKKRAEIYLIEVATGRRQLLSQFPGINGAPAWSPDGRTLAVVLSKDGNPKIYLMDLASRSLTQITDGYSIDTEPAWSKDGRSLYFTSSRGGKPQIYKMNLVSRQIERITFVGSYNARPMLTPDGKYLVMMHRAESGGNFRIASQELSSGQVFVLTHSRLDESPTLSPNGAMVLYGTQEGNRQILGLVTLDGRGQLRLPSREGSVQEPAWSPFLS